MKTLGQLSVVIGLALLAAGTTLVVKGPPQRAVPCEPGRLKSDEVCLHDVRDAEPGQILWVDARRREEWLESGLPGSVLWNLDPREDTRTFEADVAPQLLEVSQVVVYCGDENCGASRQVADQIRDLDLGPEVKVLHGGWRSLREAGMVERSKPKT